MTLSRSLPLLAAALGATAAFAAPFRAQAADDRFPATWASVPLPGQATADASVTEVAAEPVPFPRPAPRRGRQRAAEVAAVEEAAVPAEAAPPLPARTTLAYAGDERFALLWTGVPTAAAATAAPEAAAAQAAEGVPFPRPAPTRVSALASPIGGETEIRMTGRVASGRAMPGDLAALIAAKADEHGIPHALAHAVVRVESNYNPRLSSRGNLGLMQIKYGTARALGFRGTAQQLFDPATNLEWGMRYLAGAHKLAHGDVCHTILKYAGGHGATHMTRGTAAYCGKVKTYMAVAQ